MSRTGINEYVDITPTWEGLMPALFRVLESGSIEAKGSVRAELLKLARFADKSREERKAK